METMFVFTHTVMSICLICIINMFVSSSASNEQVIERSGIPSLNSMIKSIHIKYVSLGQIAAGLLAIFIK